MSETFEEMLTGGHPNSLGRTVEVVETVLANPVRFDELFACYRSDDPVVRLRTSNALKRVEAERRDLVLPVADALIDEIGVLDQPSAQWTVAQLLGRLTPDLTAAQRTRATKRLKTYLDGAEDWIVLTATMQTLGEWAAADSALRRWLAPRLERLADDERRSVAGRARKVKVALG